MIDDYKYSVGRAVVYRHPNPKREKREYGQYGAERTIGVVRSVENGPAPEHVWIYTVENLRTGEVEKVREPDIYHATHGRTGRTRQRKIDPEDLAESIASAPEESPIATYLRILLHDFLSREEADEYAKRKGRDLPVREGDYIKVRGDLRPESGSYDGRYAKILEVLEPDIAAIESPKGTYSILHSYRVQIDSGDEHVLYDPEIRLYYTANGRATVLNWRAATFLSEAFHDDPPYNVEFSFLEDHVFSREELEELSREELVNLFAALLYVKGRMGLRDFEAKDEHLSEAPEDHLIDNILQISRFDMRKNRTLSPEEIEDKRREIFKLRRMLMG